MGAAGLGAILFTLLTYVALTPNLLVRLPLVGPGLRQRIRELVGYNLACLFLAVGFFLAGVPLDGAAESETAVVVITATPAPVTPTLPSSPTPTGDISTLLELSDEVNAGGTIESITSGDSGAFGAPLEPSENATPSGESDQPETETTPDAPAATNTPSATPTPTATLTPSATPTPTATPTVTPQPTQTPIPPLGDTAVVQTGGGTLWVRRTPGGETLAVVENGSTIVLADGIANWEGTLWREVRTLDGVLGWVQNEFLVVEEE